MARSVKTDGSLFTDELEAHGLFLFNYMEKAHWFALVPWG